MSKDLVCGMEVDPQTAVAQFLYREQRFLFCSQGCREAFELNPERYLRAAELAECLDYVAGLVRGAGYAEVSQQLVDWSERLHEPCERQTGAQTLPMVHAWQCRSELWFG